MITFCPQERLTAAECLQAKAFDDIRDLDQEKTCDTLIRVQEFNNLEDAVKILCDEISLLREYWNKQNN